MGCVGNLLMLYIEGGNHLRGPMAQFIRRATGLINLKIRPCRSGNDAINKCSKDTNALLLIDSEGEDISRLTQSVKSQIGSTNSIFFMVQLMEAWFLADRQALSAYYGQGFNANSLPNNPNIEDVLKRDVEADLRNATRQSRKGAYHKGKHASGLLGWIDPTAVYNACPNFALLVDFLRRQATA